MFQLFMMILLVSYMHTMSINSPCTFKVYNVIYLCAQKKEKNHSEKNRTWIYGVVTLEGAEKIEQTNGNEKLTLPIYGKSSLRKTFGMNVVAIEAENKLVDSSPRGVEGVKGCPLRKKNFLYNFFLNCIYVWNIYFILNTKLEGSL